MPLLSEQDHKALEDRFETSLVNDVSVRLFTQSTARSLLTIPGQQAQNNESLKVTQELLEELVEISPKLSLQVLDVNGDGAGAAKSMGIEQIPAIVLGDDPVSLDAAVDTASDMIERFLFPEPDSGERRARGSARPPRDLRHRLGGRSGHRLLIRRSLIRLAS